MNKEQDIRLLESVIEKILTGFSNYPELNKKFDFYFKYLSRGYSEYPQLRQRITRRFLFIEIKTSRVVINDLNNGLDSTWIDIFKEDINLFYSIINFFKSALAAIKEKDQITARTNKLILQHVGQIEKDL